MTEYFKKVVGLKFSFIVHNAKDEIKEIKDAINLAKMDGKNWVILSSVSESAKYWFLKQGFFVCDNFSGEVIKTRISWPNP